MSFNPLTALEHALNQRAWQQLDIKPLNAPGLILPPEFYLGRDGAALSRILQPETALAVAPFAYDDTARGYMRRLKYGDFKHWHDTKSHDSFRPHLLFMGRHAYHKRELQIRREEHESAGAFTNKAIDKIAEATPHRAGQGDFLRNLERGIDTATEQFGKAHGFYLIVSPGWMPPPATTTPHHDVGPGVRVFFNVQGAGTYVAAPSSFPAEQQRWDHYTDVEDREISYSAYPSFNQLAAGWNNPKGAAVIMSIPPEYISAWKRGCNQGGQEKNAPLPHASAAYRGHLRINAIMDFPEPF